MILDDNSVTVILAAIAAIVSIATAVIATYAGRRADNAAKATHKGNEQTAELQMTVNGRLEQLINEAVGRARAEGVIAGAAASGDRRAAGLPAAVPPPAPTPTPAAPHVPDAANGTVVEGDAGGL